MESNIKAVTDDICASIPFHFGKAGHSNRRVPKEGTQPGTGTEFNDDQNERSSGFYISVAVVDFVFGVRGRGPSEVAQSSTDACQSDHSQWNASITSVKVIELKIIYQPFASTMRPKIKRIWN